MRAWQGGKFFIENNVAVSHDSLHLAFGMLVWLAFALLLRRPAITWRPWLWALAVILWNEVVDLWLEQWPDPWTQYWQGIRDVLLTMLVPTAITVAARLKPELFQARSRHRRRD